MINIFFCLKCNIFIKNSSSLKKTKEEIGINK